MVDKKIQGKKNRASGAAFERRVREDLSKKGWIVLRNPNNVIENKFIQARQKYNPFTKRMLSFTGFPDFICFKGIKGGYSIIGVECKVGKYLSREEKEKCKWLIVNKIIYQILIASKEKITNKIIYHTYIPEV
jgi:predicted Holliday junction resolvase-like endonuclease